MAMTPQDWIRKINLKAAEMITKNLSRYNPEWGAWSADMNRHIRSRITENHPDSEKLKCIFIYWVLMSQAIEYTYRLNLHIEINSNRFAEVVRALEYLKGSIESEIWPLGDLPKLASMVVGDESNRPVP